MAAKEGGNNHVRNAAPARRSVALFSSHAMAFVFGGVLVGAFFIFVDPHRAAAPVSTLPAARQDGPVAGRMSAPQAPNRGEKPAAGKTPDFDPIAEAERINEINRRNMDRTGAGPALPGRPGMPRPPGYGPRAGVPRPPRPGIPAAPAVPGVPGGEEP